VGRGSPESRLKDPQLKSNTNKKASLRVYKHTLCGGRIGLKLRRDTSDKNTNGLCHESETQNTESELLGETMKGQKLSIKSLEFRETERPQTRYS
jgi:hypothetical protein